MVFCLVLECFYLKNKNIYLIFIFFIKNKNIFFKKIKCIKNYFEDDKFEVI